MLTRTLLTTTLLVIPAAGAGAQFPPIFNPYRLQSPFLRPVAPVGLPNPLSNPAFRANYFLRQSIRPVAGVYPYAYGTSPYGNLYLQAAARQAAYLQRVNGPIDLDGPASETPGFLPDGRALVAGDIHVLCPTPDAKLFINGTELEGTGKDRHLNVPDIPVGRRHQFTLKATYKVNGEERSKERVVVLDGTNHGFANMLGL